MGAGFAAARAKCNGALVCERRAVSDYGGLGRFEGDMFADVDMLDDLGDGDDDLWQTQLLDKRYAEQRAKMVQGAARSAKSHATLDLVKAAVAADAGALASKAAAGAAATAGQRS